jgi:branched-chain amino acid transport system permease protein
MIFSEDNILLLYEITDVIIAGLSTGSVYALMAVGMTLVYGVTKAFNFAYGDFFNMGGYFAWILIVGLGLEFGGYLTILVIVMPLMFAVGYGLEKLMVAPLRKRQDWENKVMILTLGLALFLTSLYSVVFGIRMKSLPPILEGTLDVGQLVFAYQDILIFVMSLWAASCSLDGCSTTPAREWPFKPWPRIRKGPKSSAFHRSAFSHPPLPFQRSWWDSAEFC